MNGSRRGMRRGGRLATSPTCSTIRASAFVTRLSSADASRSASRQGRPVWLSDREGELHARTLHILATT